MIAVEGLRRYGYHEDAERISLKWLALVQREYVRQGYIVEKYDVIAGGSNVSGEIHFGYSANEAGFGWTNAVFTELYNALSPQDQQRLLERELLDARRQARMGRCHTIEIAEQCRPDPAAW
jgi:neutral trehalase